MRSVRNFFFLLCCSCLSATATADVVISNWDITGNTLTFDALGTIDAGTTFGAINNEIMYIGVPNDNDWVITGGGGPSTTNSGRAVNLSFITNQPGEDYVQVNTADFGNWVVGNVVDFSFNLTATSLVGANIDPADLIVVIGDNGGDPLDIARSIGTAAATAAVPEPSSFFAIGLGMIGFGVLRRRRSAAQKND